MKTLSTSTWASSSGEALFLLLPFLPLVAELFLPEEIIGETGKHLASDQRTQSWDKSLEREDNKW